MLKSGGTLVLCENNVNSLDVVLRERLVNFLKKLIGRTVPEMRKSASGTELWMQADAGGLMVRKTNMKFLSEFLAANGLIEFKRTAGQFTEFYTNLPWKGLKRFIYSLNRFYYKYLGLPCLAMGNIIYYRKM